MVPPLVAINAKYYGRKVALYVACIMYISIILTALIFHLLFSTLGITPESGRQIADVAQFKLDYTFWMNIVFAGIAALAVWLHKQHVKEHLKEKKQPEMKEIGTKQIIVYLFILILSGGLVSYFVNVF